MWVFDLEILTILEVNEAAIHHYGYSREEFLAKNLNELRVPERDRHDNNSIWDAESQGIVWTWKSSGRRWPSAAGCAR